MAIKLDAKADATIAQAAARAGMGGVPKDMSKSFEGIATGYASTMKVFGEYGAQLAQTIGQIAAPLVEEGISRVTSTIDGTYDAKGVQSTISSPIIKEIQNTRANKPKRSDEKYQVDGEFDKATFKSDRATWRQGINDLYNTAKAVKDGIFKNITQVAAGDMNAEGTGAENMFMHAAVSKEGAKIENGIEGHIGANAELVIGEDGDFSFNFKNADGKLVYGVAENGALITTPSQEGQKPLTLKKSDMNTLITPKNLAIDEASGKNVLDIAKIAKTKGADNITQSEYDQVVSTFSKSTATDNDFKHATNTVLFGKETYAETLTKPNSITQEMFTAVGGESIVGLKDVDGGGIGLSDLTDASNMAIMRRELLNPKNPNARKAFNEYYEQGLKSVAADAGRRYTPPTEEEPTSWLGSNKNLAVMGGNRYLDYDVAVDVLDSMKEATGGKNTSFNMFNEKYEYNSNTDTWSRGDGDQTFGPKDGLSGTERLVKSLGISASEFTSLKSSAQGGGDQKDFDFSTLSKDEDDALEQLKEAFPNASFEIPFSPGKDKIRFNGTDYNLKDDNSVNVLKNALSNISTGELD